MVNDGCFKNKTVLITGGSSGIGLACAEQFVALGSTVIIFSRDLTKLERATTTLGKKCFPIQGSVSSPSELHSLFQKVSDQFKKIDILIASAGISYGQSPIPTVTEDMFDDIFSVNVKGFFFTVKEAIDYMAQGACIISISSIAAHMAVSGTSLYASSKAALSQLTKNFAAELAPKGIRVNAISPGMVITPLWDHALINNPNLYEENSSKIPLNERFATAEEIANAVLFLSSEKPHILRDKIYWLIQAWLI